MNSGVKVVVIVSRKIKNYDEFLCFRYPNAERLEFIGGSIEPNEAPVDAAMREVTEEAGPINILSLRQVGEDRFYKEVTGQSQFRWIFHAKTNDIRDSWVHKVEGCGGDRGLYFQFQWLSRENVKIMLYEDMARCLQFVSDTSAI